MRYGDVTFTENGKLGEIESVVSLIGASIAGQKYQDEGPPSFFTFVYN